MVKCKGCNNIMEIVYSEKEISCCGDIEEIEEQTEDSGYEKHVPVIEKTKNGIRVKVGSIDHPMTDDHYIQFIELIAGDSVYRKYLKPGDEPAAEFPVEAGEVTAREYCNLHGLWRK
ncbi:desulfoferrodoxin [Candidatus Woesearchaeota archaeon]|nr:desulfoferrodoxin [Candidatus Woesearchaeota archaeon]